MMIQVESFGFKHGPHAGADLVFDVRFLPNPNYDRDIGHLDGFCQPIIDYVMAPDVTREFLRRWEEFLLFLVPQFQAEGKAYLTIAVGCTGGRHRSVALTNWLAGQLEGAGYRVAASHRDLAAHAPADISEPETSLPGGDAPAGASLSRAQSQTFELPREGAPNEMDGAGGRDGVMARGARARAGASGNASAKASQGARARENAQASAANGSDGAALPSAPASEGAQ